MILVEKHIFKKKSAYYKELDNLCFLSKNLYNSVLYNIRQHFFNTHQYKNKYAIINEFTQKNQQDYRALPAKVSQSLILQVDSIFKSFFASIKSNKVHHKVSIPKYLDKTSGRNLLQFTKQSISHKKLKSGKIKLTGVSFELKTNVATVENIQGARIVHKGYYIVIEILYNSKPIIYKDDNKRYASIDLGINNLATIGSNSMKPLIVNGKPLKSINQYYNKKLAELKSTQKDKKYKKSKIYSLTLKRNNKINDYLHKASRYIVNHLVSNDICKLIIGHNKNWKQEANMSRKVNQNFVCIPHFTFISMLKYKCELAGIVIVEREESYTSKCSFIDNETICKHKNYLGRRIKRGLFRSYNGILINADLNGALNILKKEVPNAFINANVIEVCSTPAVYTVKK